MSFRTAAAESLGLTNRLLDPAEWLGQIDLTNQFAEKTVRDVSIRLESNWKYELEALDNKRMMRARISELGGGETDASTSGGRCFTGPIVPSTQ
jgi:hypothetical protein